MKKLALATIAILSLLFIQSCRNDHEENLPVITLQSPADSVTVEYGDTVWMTGTITHTAELHEYMLELKNHDTDSVYFTNTTHTHETSVSFNEYWVNNVTEHTDMMFTITATDHDDNKSTKSVHFHCHPM